MGSEFENDDKQGDQAEDGEDVGGKAKGCFTKVDLDRVAASGDGEGYETVGFGGSDGDRVAIHGDVPARVVKGQVMCLKGDEGFQFDGGVGGAIVGAEQLSPFG